MRTMLLAGLVLAGSLSAQETQTAPALSGTALINQHIKAKWDEAGVKPAKRADDAEFLRRVYLDVVGVIPSMEEAEKFLDDKAMYKRAKLVESLCKDPRYATRWADVWSGIIVGFDNDVRDQGARLKATEDLHDMLAKNLPHDEFARRIIAVKGNTVERPMMAKEMEEAKIEDTGLAGYVYNISREAGKDFPLALVGKLTRSFMGIQIQCAQCHDHPFDKWTQEEFYGMASFFGNTYARRQAFDEKAMMEYMKAQRADAKPGEKKPETTPVKRPEYYVVVGDRDDATSAAPGRRAGRQMGAGGDLSIPEGKKGPIKASFLETGKGAVPGESRRTTFAKYVTSPDNLQFAKMQVNRMWAHFFGAGIVNPVDDFNAKNKATHPELLEELAKDYIAHKFDNHWLIQAIAGSDAYQLTSRSTAKEKDPQVEKWYAIQRVRSLAPEQILRSLVEATGLGEGMARAARTRPGAPAAGKGGREMQLFALLNQFRSNFGDDEGNEIVDFAGTIPSALLMMNSREVTAATMARAGGLAELLNKHATPEARIKAIYLSTLTRAPSDKEMARWKSHVSKAGSPAGYEDLSWTLLNTSEFLFNH